MRSKNIMSELKKNGSGYLKIFRDPNYYHLAFDRNVDWEIDMMLKKYKEIFHKKPKKIIDFFCANACYGRNLLTKGYDAVCYDPSLEFINFIVEQLKVNKKICMNDIESVLLNDADVCFFLFDNVAYINPKDIVALINFIYGKLSNKGMLFILSNSGTDLSYLDYSKKYINKNKDENIWIKAEWSINAEVDALDKMVNHVGKRISIINKDQDSIMDCWEYYSYESSYSKESMLDIWKRSLFCKHCQPLFYSDFSFSKYDPLGPEVVSIFKK